MFCISAWSSKKCKKSKLKAHKVVIRLRKKTSIDVKKHRCEKARASPMFDDAVAIAKFRRRRACGRVRNVTSRHRNVTSRHRNVTSNISATIAGRRSCNSVDATRAGAYAVLRGVTSSHQNVTSSHQKTFFAHHSFMFADLRKYVRLRVLCGLIPRWLDLIV